MPHGDKGRIILESFVRSGDEWVGKRSLSELHAPAYHAGGRGFDFSVLTLRLMRIARMNSNS